MPFTVKENLDVAGTPTTQGLPVFADLVAPIVVAMPPAA